MKLPVNYEKLNWRQRKKVRDEYVLLQKGLCYHCHGCLKQKPCETVLEKRVDWDLFPKGFLNHPVHLHHNHDDGMTIGAVHAYCNAVLWQYYGE